MATKEETSSDPSSYQYDDKELESGTHVQTARVTEAEEDPSKVYIERFGIFGSFLSKLFASGVEARGIERVPEDQREHRRIWNK
jgi:hypothetical protein